MINLIVAIGKNNLIGKDNDLPWNYPCDLKYFKNRTLNKSVLMGDATFYSIYNRLGKPLPKRKNIVATLDQNFNYPNIEITHDLISYLIEHQNDDEDIFVIGGKSIYTLSLPYANKLYITHINKEYEGNVYFPQIDYSLYNKEVVKVEGQEEELEFAIYTRK